MTDGGVPQAILNLRPRFLPDPDSAKEWGGKGASVAKMIRKGFPVPPSAAMGLSQVQGWLETFPEHRVAIESWRNWDDLAVPRLEALRTAILRSPMPEHWKLSAGTLRQFLCGDPQDESTSKSSGADAGGSSETFPAWPMILRSSMSAEDGANESFAGCFESVKVTDTSACRLWEGFLQVVASAFTESSARRILAAGVDPLRFRAGVLIQPYLSAELAGVCFSRDPVNPWDANGALEWVRGASEKLVQGTGASRSLRRADRPIPEVAPFWEMLWKRAKKAEDLVGGPADLEWVWDGQQLWFVQARPIATEEARLAARAPQRRWTRALTLERFPEPMTPMGWSVMQDAFHVNLRTLDRRFGIIANSPMDVAISVRGTIYSDPGFFSFPGGVSIRWSKYLNPMGPAPWKASAAFLRYLGRTLRGRGGAISSAILGLDLADTMIGQQAREIEAEWDHHRDLSMVRLQAFSAEELRAREKSELAPVLSRMDALSMISEDFMEPDLAIFLIKDTTSKALGKLWKALGFEETGFADLFRSFEGNRTLEMNGEWNTTVDQIAIEPDPAREVFLSALQGAHSFDSGLNAAKGLSAAAQEAWERFLSRNGHSTTTWDLATPTWAEDPARLAPLMSAAIRAHSKGGTRALTPSAKREESRAALALRLTHVASGSTIARVRAAIERLESFMRMDEEHHFLSGALLGPSRELILRGGKELVAAGRLGSAEEIFFITLSEFKAAVANPTGTPNLRFLSEKRRSEWNRAMLSRPAFELPVTVSPIVPALISSDGFAQWQGVPMSPGLVTGRVLVADHIDQVSGIEPGTILVTTSPNPALTPIYPLLGGLISVTGSALSHGFVSAREYALPAVSGVVGATELFANGTLVRIDGSTGLVQLVSS